MVSQLTGVLAEKGENFPELKFPPITKVGNYNG